METKHLIVWIACGVIAGLAADCLLPGRCISRLLSIIFRGILGGVAGGLAGYLLFSGEVSRPSSTTMSLLGAVMAIVVYVALRRQSME